MEGELGGNDDDMSPSSDSLAPQLKQTSMNHQNNSINTIYIP